MYMYVYVYVSPIGMNILFVSFVCLAYTYICTCMLPRNPPGDRWLRDERLLLGTMLRT